jgi:hypothetical protein
MINARSRIGPGMSGGADSHFEASKDQAVERLLHFERSQAKSGGEANQTAGKETDGNRLAPLNLIEGQVLSPVPCP